MIASTLKLWILELNPPLTLWEGWEEFRKLYPTGMFASHVERLDALLKFVLTLVGSTAKTDDSHSGEQHIQDLTGALQRLPLVHLNVIDGILKHLKTSVISLSDRVGDRITELLQVSLIPQWSPKKMRSILRNWLSLWVEVGPLSTV